MMPYDDLIQKHIDGLLTPDEADSLSRLVADDSNVRRSMIEALDLHACLAVEESIWTEATVAASSSPAPILTVSIATGLAGWRSMLSLTTLRTLVLGAVMGIAGTGVAWALTSDTVFSTAPTTIATLLERAFQDQPLGRIPEGIPGQSGLWSGDPAEVVERGNRRQIRLIRAGANPGQPDGQAISCDIYRVIDLTPYASLTENGDVILELKATYGVDSRDTDPPLGAACYVNVFSRPPTTLWSQWPLGVENSVSIGSKFVPLEPSAAKQGSSVQSTVVKVRCLLPPDASHAVVQLGVGRANADYQGEIVLGRHWIEDVSIRLTWASGHITELSLAERGL